MHLTHTISFLRDICMALYERKVLLMATTYFYKTVTKKRHPHADRDIDPYRPRHTRIDWIAQEDIGHVPLATFNRIIEAYKDYEDTKGF